MQTDHDRQLERDIRQALVFDKRLSAQPIEVGVQDGIVRLSGTVQSHRRALAAYEVAASVQGVKGITNELSVIPPGVVPDPEIAEMVRSVLAAHADVVKAAITVAVDGGVVTLQGSVADEWQREIAEDVARSGRGVRDVRNLLVASPTDQVNDEECSRMIQDAVRNACGLAGMNIQVGVSWPQVVLSGSVTSFAAKELALRIAQRFGCRQIRNEIQVMP